MFTAFRIIPKCSLLITSAWATYAHLAPVLKSLDHHLLLQASSLVSNILDTKGSQFKTLSNLAQSPTSLHEHKYAGFVVYLCSFLLGLFHPSYQVSIGPFVFCEIRGTMYMTAAIAMPLAARMRVMARGGQTTAVCEQQFAWMQNSLGQTPCLVAASVGDVCFNSNYVVSALPSGNSYNKPTSSNGTANACTCSWAYYNLLSACTICQGDSQEIPSWSDYSFGCGGLLSNTFFPSNITLPMGLIIPAWAQMNASQWDGGAFSEIQANQIATKAPDSPTSPPHNKRNDGPVIGGVIGGVIVLLSVVLIAVWMIRRSRRSSTSNARHGRPGHKHTRSDESNLVKPLEGYESMRSYPISPIINSSVHSFSAFGSMIPGQTPSIVSARPAESLAAGPSQQQVLPSISTNQQTVTPFPFNAQPTAGHPEGKQSNGPQPTYDHLSSPPRGRSGSSSTTPRARMIPPAYTPPESKLVNSSQTRHARKQLSTDTQHSLPSSRDGRTAAQYGHSPSASGGSGTTDLISPRVPATSAEPTNGRVLSGSSRDEKRSNTVLQYNGSDLA